MKSRLCLCIVVFHLVSPVWAQRLSIDEIMEGEDFVGVSPSEIRWSGDGNRIYFRWRSPGEEDRGTYVIDRSGTGLRRLDEEEERRSRPVDGVWDRARERFLGVREGDVFVFHRDGSRRRLTEGPAVDGDARFTHDERGVWFTRRGNLFLLDLEEGGLRQITDFRPPPAPVEPEPPPARRFLVEEQERLFEEFSGRRKRERERAEERKKERDRRVHYLQEGESLSDLRLSPDERFVVFVSERRPRKARTTAVPRLVTPDGYTEVLESRTKVADLQPERRLGVYEVESGRVTWPELEGEVLTEVRWNSRGDTCALMVISSDFKRRLLVSLDLEEGGDRILDELHDEAWIGGPGMLTFDWLPDGDHLYFISERTGWAHLYRIHRDGSDLLPLTSGEWEVHSVELSLDGSFWYLVTGEEHPGERHLYRMPLEGGQRVRLTAETGRHDVFLSPDHSHAAVLFSRSNHPPELYVQSVEEGHESIRLTRSTTERFRAHRWVDPELVRIPARDGARPWARLYRPENPAPGLPAVIFVHGAGYLQNVHKWWSQYYREYMFHHFLMEHGYHVLDIDFRASAGYGRDWRTAVYRHMGGKDLTDQVDGARWLVSELGVNPEKIGIYGGSYGGFITLMALFTEPGVFAAGAALRPVTDWAHYNHRYTSRILDLPHEDPEAYRRSSPIYFAEGLEGGLLISHGMVDTNVHFQDTARLVQRLIELRKEQWEVAVYPVEDHAFANPSSWADQYRRIFLLFERYLKR